MNGVMIGGWVGLIIATILIVALQLFGDWRDSVIDRLMEEQDAIRSELYERIRENLDRIEAAQ